MSVKVDVWQSIKLMRRCQNKFAKYSLMYPFTTENIKGYLNYNKKRILTIGGSGDHMLNAILNGAERIVNFDINKLAYYIINLKIAAVKTLKLKEFINYFNLDNDSALSYEIFNKIKRELKKDVRIYFEKLYQGDIRKMFVNNYPINLDLNEYLNKHNFNKLKCNIKNADYIFICSPLDKIVKKIKKEKFDLILLSNVSDYIKDVFNDNYLEKYQVFIEKELSKNLHKNGEIILAYIYDYQKSKTEGRTDIDNEIKRAKVFNRKFKIKTFPSVLSKDLKDAVIIYRR